MTDQAANLGANHEQLVERAKLVLAAQKRAIPRASEALGATNAAVRSLENHRYDRSVNVHWS